VLPLSPNQRLVTVEVGQGETRRWLVLGVTPRASARCTRWRRRTMCRQPPAPALRAVLAQLLQRAQARER
jgi:flagellar protein FliO/FliZ